MITKLNKKICCSGQAVLEYALVLAIVSAALLAMSLYMRRAVQGGLYKIEARVTGKQNSTVAISPPFLP